MKCLQISAEDLRGDKDVIRQYIVPGKKTCIKGLCIFEKRYNVTSQSIACNDAVLNPNIECFLKVTAKTSHTKNRILLATSLIFSIYNGHSDFYLKISLLNKYLHQLVLYNFKGDASKSNINLGVEPIDNFEDLYVDKSNNYKIIFELISRPNMLIPTILHQQPQYSLSLEAIKDEQESVNEDSNRSCDLLSLLNLGDFSDLTIIIEDQIIKAHKNILAAQSPIFFQMFKKPDGGEFQSLKMELKDVNYQIFKDLLHYMYSGKIKYFREEFALEYLEHAIKFAVKNVIPIYEKKVMNQIRLENSIDYLSFADSRDLENLKVFAMQFIIKNIDKFVIRQLKQLNSTLLAEVMIESQKTKNN